MFAPGCTSDDDGGAEGTTSGSADETSTSRADETTSSTDDGAATTGTATTTTTDDGQEEDVGTGADYDGLQPLFQVKCGPCHDGNSAGATNFAAVREDFSEPAGATICAGQSLGECIVSRAQNGSMPRSRGCTGNPELDAGKTACLTAEQHARLVEWAANGFD